MFFFVLVFARFFNTSMITGVVGVFIAVGYHYLWWRNIRLRRKTFSCLIICMYSIHPYSAGNVCVMFPWKKWHCTAIGHMTYNDPSIGIALS